MFTVDSYKVRHKIMLPETTKNTFIVPAQGSTHQLRSPAAQSICLSGSKAILQRLLQTTLQIHHALIRTAAECS